MRHEMHHAMQLSTRGFDFIKSFEGYHTALPDGGCKAYLDTLAKPPIWTIAWGVTEGVTPGMVMTLAEAEAAFRKELAKHEAIVRRVVTVEIGQNNFDALCSFQYNTGGLPGSTLLKKLNKGDFDGAAREFDRWKTAGGKVYKGLVRRRAAERAMFEADARDEDIAVGQPDMPQTAEPTSTPVSKGTVATLAASGGAVIPAIPGVVSDTATNAQSWQGLAEQTLSLGKWATSSSSLLVVAAGAAVVLGLMALSKWRQA